MCAEVVQQIMAQLRQPHHLDVLDLKDALHGLGAQRRLGDVVGEDNLDDAALARLGALYLIREMLGHAVLERQLSLDAGPHFLGGADQPVAVAGRQVRDDDVADVYRGLAGAIRRLGHELSIRLQQAPFAAGHVFVGEGSHRSLQLQSLVTRQIELRPHFDVKFVNQRAFIRNIDLVRVDVGRGQRRDVVLVGELFEALQQHLGLNLLVDVLAEAFFDDLARRFTRPEAGHVGIHHQLAVLLIEAGVDVGPFDGNLDVLLARADVDQLDGLVQLFGLLLLAVLACRFRRRLGNTCGAFTGRLGHGRSIFAAWLFRARLVGHRMLPPKGKKAEGPRAFFPYTIASRCRGQGKKALGRLGQKKAGDGARTHDFHVGNVTLYH